MDLLAAEMIDGSFVPRRSASVATVELDGEVVVFGGRDHVFYRLDPVASLIWSCFDGSGPVEDIAADLAAELAAPVAMVSDDVVTLTRMLGHLGFLEGVHHDHAEAPPMVWLTDPGTTAAEQGRRVMEPPSG